MKTQRELFDLIAKKEFKNKKLMYKHVADFLCVSTDAVSKWSYGTTVINYVYLKKIIEHFKIRPDELFKPKSDYFYVKYNSLDMKNISLYRDYIYGLDQLLSSASNVPNAKIYFQADEIPIFHFMPYKLLTYFKLYAYAYDMNKLELSFEEYIKELDTYDLEPIFKSIARNYDNIESTEIWDYGILDNLLAQIGYFDELERFKSSDIKSQLLDDLCELLDNFKSLATAGEKSSGKRFDFFVKPFPLGRSFMVIDADQLQSVSLKVDTINSLTMTDRRLVDESYTTFFAAREKSLAVGIGSERERMKYFKNLKDKIVNIKNKQNDLDN